MNHLFLRRRQLLYFGLGIAGLGATVLGSRSTFTQSTPPAPRADLQSEAIAAVNQLLLEFQGISQWLNSDPLTVANLKGQVLLVQVLKGFPLPFVLSAQRAKVVAKDRPNFLDERCAGAQS
jgi:hypothetical protein